MISKKNNAEKKKKRTLTKKNIYRGKLIRLSEQGEECQGLGIICKF